MTPEVFSEGVEVDEYREISYNSKQNCWQR